MKQFKLCQNKILRKNGQGLIEVLVSLALLIVGILGSLTLATITIRAGIESRERVQAALLAQEGIEIVKNNRDTNWIKKAKGESVNWNDNLFRNENFSNIPSNSLSESGGTCGGNFDKFTRKITIEDTVPPDPNNKKKVTCEVSWTDASGTHRVTAIDYITNWQKQE